MEESLGKRWHTIQPRNRCEAEVFKVSARMFNTKNGRQQIGVAGGSKEGRWTESHRNWIRRRRRRRRRRRG